MYPHIAGPGRPKGLTNKASREVKEAARNIVDDPAYREALRYRVMCGYAPYMETLLWHYAYGKPKETIELQGELTVEKITREIIEPGQIIEAQATLVEDAIH